MGSSKTKTHSASFYGAWKKPTLNYGFTVLLKHGENIPICCCFFSQQAHSNINIYNQLQQTAILAHSFF